ncbi:hypothetical protein EMIT0P291_320012 [Pseudomonas sp. IT-P291]
MSSTFFFRSIGLGLEDIAIANELYQLHMKSNRVEVQKSFCLFQRNNKVLHGIPGNTDTCKNCGAAIRLAIDGDLSAEHLLPGVHIHCCGYGHYWFRPYGGSLGKAPSNQGLLPLTFGASLWLGMPSLRSCSVGPPRSAIHGRTRLTRHPCRVAHCAEPALGLTRGRAPQQHREAS